MARLRGLRPAARSGRGGAHLRRDGGRCRRTACREPAGGAHAALPALGRVRAGKRGRFRNGRDAGADGGNGARPSGPLRLRGRDAPGAARPRGVRHGLPAVRGERARLRIGLPVRRRAAQGGGAAGRARRAARPGLAAARARTFRAPRPLSPGAGRRRRRTVRRRGMRGAGGWRRLPLYGRAGRRRRQGGAHAGRGPVRRLALRLLPLAEGAGRDLRTLAGDEGAARHQDRRQGGGAHPEERLHRRDRHLAGGR